ncbi:hypothetical protein Aglo03_26060 [Actinokineospora globicatena]|uniref:Phage portal protein, SPP1 Gp6-like n=1 Tax=Actinokineospora globicatena TaxID=103729 RepID=A0A9W6V6P2_9PSEU|nr:hypothetical protein Aglo03_26060 [Actinokineospora globicatena]
MLINPGSPWPPPGHSRMRARWQSWLAWWGGDPAELKQHTPASAPGGYWHRRALKPGQSEIHVPLAADICRTSAELVAGDTPAIVWDDDDTTVQAACDDLLQQVGFANTLLEGVETGAAMGDWYLRPTWDLAVSDLPTLTVAAADEVLPTFRFGRLRDCVFVTVLDAPSGWNARGKGEVWRWLEHHEPNQIRHELWLGTETSVGTLLPLTDHPTTADLDGVIDTKEIRPGGILAERIPNDLPNPLARPLPLGRSDLQGIETLLDQLDAAWDSWMRDLDLGKMRIMLSREMLQPVATSGKWGRGSSAPAKGFDIDDAAFVPLEMPMEDGGKVTPITPIEFKLRVQEHADTVFALVETIVQRAGYAPQTFGMNVDGQLSGTAMRRREQRSYRTRDRKRRYARAAIERAVETLMLINSLPPFNGPKPTQRPTLEWRETDQSDPLETAQTIELLRRAKALSTEYAVRMTHPDWDDDQITAEVKAIEKEEQASLAPSPFGDGTDPVVPRNPAPVDGEE